MDTIVEGRRVAYDFDPVSEIGRPVVAFVHGLAASRAAWSGIAERVVREGFGALRYDLRGHGESAPVDCPCSRSELATDLVALMDALTIPKAVVVGHSAGGVIAMQCAVDHPGRVAAVVLVGTASECNDRTAAWYRSTAEQAEHAGGAEAMKAMGVRAIAGAIPDGPTFAHVARAMASLREQPLTQRLRESELAALIVVGEKDFLGAGGSVILHRTIANSELEIRAGRGHAVQLEDPEWFGERLGAFLRSRVLGTA